MLEWLGKNIGGGVAPVQIFDKYSRSEWKSFKQMKRHDKLLVTKDYVTSEEIQEIYLPLIEYMEISIDHIKALNYKQQAYVDMQAHIEPFVIGLSGGVSVGKSTVSTVLRDLLRQVYPDKKVEIINTDGFLFPNQYLNDHGILNRKGFPESYDMDSLIEFVNDVRQAKGPLEYPIYSHEIYDIVPNKKAVLDQPNILIVEGVIVLQTPNNPAITLNDFLDFTIYVDAEFDNVFEWFLNRYRKIFDKVKNDPTNYYYEMAHWPDDKMVDFAKNIWATINTPNLENYIAPTKDRANIILHKGKNHYIDEIYVRKF